MWSRLREVRECLIRKCWNIFCLAVFLGFTFASPRMYTGTPGLVSARETRTMSSAVRAVRKSGSRPLVGRYMPICTDGDRPGIERDRGSTEGEVVGSTVIKGSRLECQRASVPPQACRWSRAMEGRVESSLLRWKLKLAIGLRARVASHWNNWGSDRNIRAVG